MLTKKKAPATELIRISSNTKKTLDALGKKNETYDDIIIKLLK